MWKPFPQASCKSTKDLPVGDAEDDEKGALDLYELCGTEVDENSFSPGRGFPPDRLPNPMRAARPLIPFEGEFEQDVDLLKSMGLPLGFLPSPFDLDRVSGLMPCHCSPSISSWTVVRAVSS